MSPYATRLAPRPMPRHPGRILWEDWIEPLQLSQADLATAFEMNRHQIERLLSGQLPITATLANRIAAVLNVSAGYWLASQVEYDRAVKVTRQRPAEAASDVPCWTSLLLFSAAGQHQA